ncbi:MAG: hypothetical protein FWD78_17665 [Treponema sp.]|nr:hypothetical protein [Treponema sp.]
MKKSGFLLCALLAFLSFGCTDPTSNPSDDTKIQNLLKVGETSLVFTAAGGSQLVAVSGTADWTAASDQTWCNVSPAQGSGDGSITITLQQNSTVVQRSANITVAATQGGISCNILITQAAGQPTGPVTDSDGHSIDATPAALEFQSAGGSKSLQVTANVEWQIVSDQTWCDATGSSGIGFNINLDVTVSANTGASRYAILTISNTEYGLSMDIAVTQEAGSVKTFTYTASAGSGGTISPSGQVSITQGEDKTFTASPNTGNMVDQWIVNGNVAASSGTSYTVTNVQANGTIQATFKATQPAIDANKIPGAWQAVTLVADDGTTTTYNSTIGILFTLNNDKSFDWNVQNSNPSTVKVEVKGTWTYSAVNQTIVCTGTMYLGGSAFATQNDTYLVQQLSDTTLVFTEAGATYTFNKVNVAVTDFAPTSLARGYIFATQPGGNTSNTVTYWIWNASQGFSPFNTFSNYVYIQPTSYTYSKTGPNTATFSYAIEQYNSNGVTPYRYWVYSGTLTYTSATQCDYVYSNTYQGALQYSNQKVTFYVRIDPSAVYLPY